MIAAFDLGGSGLKGALYDDDMTRMTGVLNLGQCGERSLPAVQAWFQFAIQQMIQAADGRPANRLRIGFSLAGLRKLFTAANAGKLVLPAKTRADLQAFFGIAPQVPVAVLEDGEAHLLASLRSSLWFPGRPHLNLAVGTSVAFGLADQAGKIVRLDTLCAAFGMKPWLLPPSATEPVVNPANTAGGLLGGRGLQSWQAKVPGQAREKFSNAWGDFVADLLLDAICQSSLPFPETITFTGGVIDHDRLDLCVVRHRVAKYCQQRGLNPTSVEKGPPVAGIQGAALAAQADDAVLSNLHTP